jgi:hypothetical protein
MAAGIVALLIHDTLRWQLGENVNSRGMTLIWLYF